ncbi:winged helix-turn-helix transcriptional regulator [uncultured Amnibacterium sp.]|uniref:winged helix-turn-helix transcriptional regulator n=1 Tax=uncultured Amnibacterium sp. TaxID=1631851 RepID=UPI0035CC6B19
MPWSADARAKSGYESRCRGHDEDGAAIRTLLDRIGDKWSLLVIVTLREGTLRFSELRRHIPGVSQRMLTLTLRHLERDGLLSRVVHAEVPPRVEYTLTGLGHTLLEPAAALADWAVANHGTIESARASFDARTATGIEVQRAPAP